VLEEDETVQCSAERLAGWQGKKEQERSKRYQQIHLQQSKLQKAKTQVDQFLQNHDIRSDSRDVNVARRDWHMVRLLLFFGADPALRDSRGRTSYDYMGPFSRAE
ncbi:unnamed protein product, partial [Symbiodinium sp. KB8]